MTSGRRAITTLVICVFLAACASRGGSRPRTVPSSSTIPAPAGDSMIALRDQSIVALAGNGPVTVEAGPAEPVGGQIRAVFRLAGGSVVYAGERDVRTFDNRAFRMTGGVIGVSRDGSKIATLDWNTGKIEINDGTTHPDRTITTRKANSRGNAPDSIAWTDNDTTLTVVDPATHALVVIDATSGATRRRLAPAAHGTYKWPMDLPDHQAAVVETVPGGPDQLVRVDLRTGGTRELGTLQSQPGITRTNNVLMATATADRKGVLFVGRDRKLYRFDLATHASTPFGTETGYSWVDA